MASYCSQQCKILTCSPCRELQVLQGEVDAAEIALCNAKRRRAAHLERMNGRKAAVTRLPTEIVRYIIELFIGLPDNEMHASEYASYPGHDRPRGFRAVHRWSTLLLGAISQQWRTIAWSFPHLWTSIVIPLSCPRHEHGPQMVSEWLQRSGELPLSIQINNPKYLHDSYDDVEKARIHEHAKAIVKVLNQYASRWETLDFSETGLDVFEDLDRGKYEGESQLRHLCLGGASDEYGYSWDSPTGYPGLFENSPRKYHPTHLNLLFYIHPSNLNIQWSAITHLFLENVSRNLLFDMLDHIAANITHLSVRAINCEDAIDMDWEPENATTLPHLISLSINMSETVGTHTSILFRNLLTPSLRHISYDGVDSGFVFPCNELFNLIALSACQLEELDLTFTGLSDVELHFLLRSIPTLRRLKIRLGEGHNTQAFLQCLGAAKLKTDISPFLPALSRLDISAFVLRDTWSDFIAIYGSPQTFNIDGDPSDDTVLIPPRLSLKVKFDVRYKSRYRLHGMHVGDCLMDKESLKQLVFLWRTFGIVCVFHLLEDDYASPDPYSFLKRSHRMWQSGLPTIRRREAETRFMELWDDVVNMANLQL